MKIASVTVEVATEEQLDALLAFVREGRGLEAPPAPVVPQEPTAPLAGRRRLRGSRDDASVSEEGASQPTPSSTPSPSAHTQTQTTDEQQASPTRRRRSYVSDAAAPSTEPAPSAATPSPVSEGSGRRRRATASPDVAASAGTASGSATAPTGRRARRPEAAPTTEAKAAPANDKIEDEDLTKAASAAGRLIPPKEIRSYLVNEFGVTQLGELPQDRRAEFLAGLKDLLADADNAG